MNHQAIKQFRRLLLLILLLLAWTPAPASDNPLFRPPVVDHVRLAPDGQHLALVRRKQDFWYLEVGPTNGPLQPVYNSRGEAISQMVWLTNRRLLLKLESPGRLPRLLALERNGLATLSLTPASWRDGDGEGARLIDLLPADPVHILISSDAAKPWQPDVFRLNVYTGERKLIESNPGRTFSWMTDRRGNIRLRSDFRQIGSKLAYTHYWKPENSTGWRPLYRYLLGAPGITPLMFDLDNQQLIVSSDLQGDTRDIFRFDPSSGQLEEPIYRDIRADLSFLRMTGAGRGPAMVSVNAGRPEQVYLDEQWRDTGAQIDRQLPATHNRIVSLSQSERQMVVLAYSDRYPGSYYYFDSQQQLIHIADRQPDIRPDQMVDTRVLNIESRDGLKLQSYLTVPRTGSGPWPLLVYVHGGPWFRDTWGFDPLVQALAGEGIAVLKVNYRGSRGLGRRLLTAGVGEWGRKMQDDLQDAVNWAVRANIAVPERVCIMGHSYGGYAALMGVLRDPEVYRCAVANAPVTDITRQMAAYQQQNHQLAYAEWRQLVADPRIDGKYLKEVSPITHIAGLRRPVLLSHGNLDRVVDHRQSLDLMDQAGQARNLISWLELTGSDHRLTSAKSRQRFFKATLEFLRRYLKPDVGQTRNSQAP